MDDERYAHDHFPLATPNVASSSEDKVINVCSSRVCRWVLFVFLMIPFDDILLELLNTLHTPSIGKRRLHVGKENLEFLPSYGSPPPGLVSCK